MKTKLILISHAYTQWNIENKPQGHYDIPLNDFGQKMACVIAKRLERESISAIYTSDLKRAYQTVEFYEKSNHIPIYKDEMLRECRFDDQSNEDSSQQLLPFYVEKETLNEALERFSNKMNEIAKKHMDETILVVSHGAIIEEFINYVNKSSKEPKAYYGIRGAINKLVYEDDTWNICSLNDIRYLIKYVNKCKDDIMNTYGESSKEYEEIMKFVL